jgi:hypothetical protein
MYRNNLNSLGKGSKMQNRKVLILASAAALAGAPMVANAAPILTFTWEISTDGGVTYAPIASGSQVNLAKGATDYLGLLVDLNGTSPNAAFSGPYSVSPHLQPQYLGLTSFGFGFNNSNGVATTMDSTYVEQAGTPSPDLAGNNPPGPYTGVGTPGTDDGSGGIAASSLSGSFIAATASVNTTAKAAGNVGWGGNANAEIFRDLSITGGATGGTSVITPLTLSTSFNYTTDVTTGTTTTAPTYGQSGTGYTAVLPTLSFIVPGGVSTATHQPIISLISSSSTPGATYGQADGMITMTGKGNGSYNVSTAAGFTAATTGGIDVKGFNPTSDTEIYALKLTSNGVAISGTQITTVIADINGGSGNTTAVGVTASAITGVYTNLFPGYQVLLTSAAGVTDDAELNFDFSSTGEQDSAVPGLVLTGVAAVPEPATAAGVVLGAAGLLLGRRKNRISVS